MIEHGEFVRNSDVTAPPIRVRAAHAEIVGELIGQDVATAIPPRKAQRIKPELMDER